MHKSARNIILTALSVLLLTGGLIYYFNYNMSLVRQDYNAKILDLNEQIARNLENVRGQIGLLGANLS